MQVLQGDITLESTDAIVNAANSSLMGGGGVDGAIHLQGGPEILRDCKRLRSSCYPEGLPTGQAVITSAGRLSARYIIHTVGPVWSDGEHGEEELLYSCYQNCLRLAEEYQLNSIAFPAISTGIYGYPRIRAAELVSRVLNHWHWPDSCLESVHLVFFTQEDYQIFCQSNNLSQ